MSEKGFLEFIRGKEFEVLALPPAATDACVDAVIRTNLTRQLGLQGTTITADGRKRLVAAFPRCWIESDDGAIEPRAK